jgi:circadian clock protein KaiB
MYRLRLYLAGRSERSRKAIDDLQTLLETNFRDRYSLEIIELKKNPHLAQEDSVLAAPTVVRTSPPPLRRTVGDLSKSENVLAGLGLEDIEERK